MTFGRMAIRPFKSLSGLAIPAETFPEAASQTFKKGALVFLSAGYLRECGADPTLIMGVAANDGQNGATAGAKQQLVHLAHPDTLFIGNIDDGGDPGGATAISEATDRAKMYGVVKHSGGTWCVDKGDTTNKRVIIWDFWDGVQDGVAAAIGDKLHPVIFAFDPQYFQGHRTS